MHDGLPLHGKSLLFGLVLLTALGAFVVTHAPRPHEPETAHLIVEQSGATALALTVTTKSGASLVDVRVEGPESTHINLPSSWRASVIKASSGTTVTVEDEGLGYRRVTFPPASSVRFASPVAPERFAVENPSRKPLSITVELIDLSSHRVRRLSKLSNDAHILLAP